MVINRYIFHRVVLKLKTKLRKHHHPAVAIGISSLVNSKHNTHVPFLDYDEKSIDVVSEDLQKLTKRFKLRTGYILKSRNGFHALFPFDVREWEEVKRIIKSSRVDWRYKSFTDEYGKSFLRVAGKYKNFDISLYGVTKSPYKSTHDEAILGNGILESHMDLFKIHNELDFKGMVKE